MAPPRTRTNSTSSTARLKRWAAVIVAVATVVACGNGGDSSSSSDEGGAAGSRSTTKTTPADKSIEDDRPTTSTTKPKKKKPATTTSTTTTLPPIPRQPLTGVPLGKGEKAIPRPALVVKIDNAPGARPNHTGFGSADLVYEEIVEADITRFAAVFHSQDPGTVGPIRSGRSQDVDLLTSLDRPLFAWSGGNPGVTKLIAESSFVDLNAQKNGKGYYRGSGKAPHNMFNSTDRLWEQTPADDMKAPKAQFPYLRPKQEFKGDPVGGLKVKMRGIDVEWNWDAESGKFLRSQEGRPHNVQPTGQVSATNVVVLVVEYYPSKIDTKSPEAQTLGVSAPAFVFSNGQVRAVRWARADATKPFRLMTVDGKEVGLQPGNTWVELAEAFNSGDAANPNVNLEFIPAS